MIISPEIMNAIISALLAIIGAGVGFVLKQIINIRSEIEKQKTDVLNCELRTSEKYDKQIAQLRTESEVSKSEIKEVRADIFDLKSDIEKLNDKTDKNQDEMNLKLEKLTEIFNELKTDFKSRNRRNS